MNEMGLTPRDDDHENHPGRDTRNFGQTYGPFLAHFWQLASTFIVLFHTESILALKVNIYLETH